MGISACFVSLVLKLTASIPDSSIRRPDLVVRIQRNEAEPELASESVEQVDDLGHQEVAAPTETASVTPETSQTYERPVVDWRNTIVETVAAIGEESQRREDSRERMWRTTHSVMFKSEGSYVPKQQEPVIQDFRFKPQIHVAGLGVTIGSCFIGLPIVGVPVEERTVAISLFVCAKD
jgi:hypothetical protein